MRKMRSLLRRMREVGPSGVALLCEAFWLLLAAKVALALGADEESCRVEAAGVGQFCREENETI